VITPWAFGHFLLRSQGVFALPVGKDSTQRSVQFSGAGSVHGFAMLTAARAGTGGGSAAVGMKASTTALRRRTARTSSA